MANKLGTMFGLKPDAEKNPDPNLPIPLAKIGIEIEVENCPMSGRLPKFDHWEYKEDHSLRNNGLEWVTNGPVYGTEISKALTEILSEAVKLKWSDGHPRAGIHIHLDVRDLDFDRNDLARLVSNYMIVEHAMFAYAGEWRRCTQYCDAFEDAQYDFKSLGKFLFDPPKTRGELQDLVSNFSKYQALNLRPLQDLGTVEFRALPTTFDYIRILDWIRIILAIKRSAMNAKIDDPLKVLSAVGPIEYCRIILGETYPILAGFIDQRKIWDAVGNATALMTYGNTHTKTTKEKSLGWEAPEVPLNPVYAKYLEEAKKKPKEKVPGKVKPVKLTATTTGVAPRRLDQIWAIDEFGDVREVPGPRPTLADPLQQAGMLNERAQEAVVRAQRNFQRTLQEAAARNRRNLQEFPVMPEDNEEF